jgi:D-arabinose 1-dehydrogenase-like Zn-dependent alcohol dehydrogenase
MQRPTYNAKAYSAASPRSGLASSKIPRREPTERDVQIEILFCGICHSDLHSVRNEWSEFMATNYPIVPGHEIVGRVTNVGSAVSTYKSAISWLSAAWSTRTAPAIIAKLASNSCARTWF